VTTLREELAQSHLCDATDVKTKKHTHVDIVVVVVVVEIGVCVNVCSLPADLLAHTRRLVAMRLPL
jgi:hypothetical protein